MKGTVVTKIPFLLALGLAGVLTLAAPAQVQARDLDNQIRKLTAKFEAMQQKPDKRVPADMLRRAKGIILLDRTKAGFIFAFQGGSGVAMVKDDEGQWGPPAFLSASEASLGFQIGGEQNFFVILLMSTNATHALTDSIIDFGGEARGTAGGQSSGVEGEAVQPPSMVVYCDRSGLYGGATVKGGAITPDDDANASYYGHYVTMNDILFGNQLKPTEAAGELARQISKYSK